jgi:ketopantoate reductase
MNFGIGTLGKGSATSESGEVSMKIAVMAAGGVGGYFGARLAAGGEDVHFIARGAFGRAARQGLTLNSATGAQKVRGRPV